MRVQKSDLRYRLGTIEDLGQIRKLQDDCSFLKGFDFLSTIIPYWIHSKLYQIHVVEHNAAIVST